VIVVFVLVANGGIFVLLLFPVPLLLSVLPPLETLFGVSLLLLPLLLAEKIVSVVVLADMIGLVDVEMIGIVVEMVGIVVEMIGIVGSGIGIVGNGIGIVGIGIVGNGIVIVGNGIGIVGNGIGIVGSGIGIVGNGIGIVGIGIVDMIAHVGAVEIWEWLAILWI
jgi:hypothetical protein